MRWLTERVRSGDHEPARRFAEALVMNGDDDVIEAARPWMGPSTWENVQHMYWHRSGKLPLTS